MMKPVLIFEHIETSAPGLFEIFLKQRSIPFQILRPNFGDEVPVRECISVYSGLCFLGGIESLTKPTDTLLREIDLIRAAREAGTPVLGHCLGQLISKALGGEVTKHHMDEFGWSRLYLENKKVSREWLAELPTELKVMQWHSDSFSIPQGAVRILTGEHCANQAFVFNNMLAMQFHVEIDKNMIEHWALNLVEKHPPVSDSVQTGEQIIASIENHFESSRWLAEQLYSKWAEHLE